MECVTQHLPFLDLFLSTQEVLHKKQYPALFSPLPPPHQSSVSPCIPLTDCDTFQDSFIQHSFTSRLVCPPLLRLGPVFY